MIHNSSQAGTTLIEVLIYITILGFVITASLMTTYQILSGSDSLAYKNITEEEAGFIIAKIDWALNDISAITSPAPNGSGDTLRVDKNGQTIELTKTPVGDDITMKKGTGPAILLNSDRVAITNLNFNFIQKTGASTVNSIKTSFDANGEYFETLQFIR